MNPPPAKNDDEDIEWLGGPDPSVGTSSDPSLDAGAATRVLVVDDEPMIREVLVQYLERDGFQVTAAADGVEAIESLAKERPDLVLLDIMLPSVSGLEVLERIRSGGGEIPVILLTARGAEADRVAGLELGADDYVVKPFSPREVAARVRSVLRRTQPQESSPVAEFGAVTVDLSRRSVMVDGAEVELTRKEFDLLAYFIGHSQEALSRAHLLEQVWGSSDEWQDPATVTVHVSRLRQKLEADPSKPAHLVTVFGVGYRFEP